MSGCHQLLLVFCGAAIARSVKILVSLAREERSNFSYVSLLSMSRLQVFLCGGAGTKVFYSALPVGLKKFSNELFELCRENFPSDCVGLGLHPQGIVLLSSLQYLYFVVVAVLGCNPDPKTSIVQGKSFLTRFDQVEVVYNIPIQNLSTSRFGEMRLYKPNFLPILTLSNFYISADCPSLQKIKKCVPPIKLG